MWLNALLNLGGFVYWILFLSTLTAAEPVWPWDTTRSYQIQAQMRRVVVDGTWVRSKATGVSATLSCAPQKKNTIGCTIDEIVLESEGSAPAGPNDFMGSLSGGTFSLQQTRSGLVRGFSDVRFSSGIPEVDEAMARLIELRDGDIILLDVLAMCFDNQRPRSGDVSVGDRWVQRQNRMMDHVLTDHEVVSMEGPIATIEAESRRDLSEGIITGSYRVNVETGVILTSERRTSREIIYNKQMDAFPESYEAVCTLIE